MSEVLLSHKVPEDVEEQTCRLVEAGIAERVLRQLPFMRANAQGVTLEECQFWAQKVDRSDEADGPSLQIVILNTLVAGKATRSRSMAAP